MAHKYPNSGGGAKNTLLSALAAAYANPEIADAKPLAKPDEGDPSLGGAGGGVGAQGLGRDNIKFPFYKQPSFWQNVLSGGQAGQNAWSGNDASMRSQAQGAQQLDNQTAIEKLRQSGVLSEQDAQEIHARNLAAFNAGLKQNETSQGYYNDLSKSTGIPVDQSQFQGTPLNQPLSTPQELQLLHREMQTPVAQEGVFGASMARNVAPGLANEASQANTASLLTSSQNASQELPTIIATRNAAIQAQQGQELRAQQLFDAQRPYMGQKVLHEGEAVLGLPPSQAAGAAFVNPARPVETPIDLNAIRRGVIPPQKTILPANIEYPNGGLISAPVRPVPSGPQGMQGNTPVTNTQGQLVKEVPGGVIIGNKFYPRKSSVTK